MLIFSFAPSLRETGCQPSEPAEQTAAEPADSASYVILWSVTFELIFIVFI